MGLFGPTVRDFSKSHEGRKCLEAMFKYEALPSPNLTSIIDELGIYYARHGVLIKQNIAELVRFPLNRVTRNAFDFAVEFSRWRTKKLHGNDDNYAMLEVIRELHPRPKWVAKILKIRQEGFHSRTHILPQKIVLPKNFLLDNC
jgi:hypothetical protein